MLTPTVYPVPASALMSAVSRDTFGDGLFCPVVVNRPATLPPRHLAPITITRTIDRQTI